MACRALICRSLAFRSVSFQLQIQYLLYIEQNSLLDISFTIHDLVVFYLASDLRNLMELGMKRWITIQSRLIFCPGDVISVSWTWTETMYCICKS